MGWTDPGSMPAFTVGQSVDAPTVNEIIGDLSVLARCLPIVAINSSIVSGPTSPGFVAAGGRTNVIYPTGGYNLVFPGGGFANAFDMALIHVEAQGSVTTSCSPVIIATSQFSMQVKVLSASGEYTNGQHVIFSYLAIGH